MRILLLTLVCLLALCGTATAQSWVDCVSGNDKSSIANGGVLCFDMERDGVLISRLVWFGHCKNGVTYWYSQDTAGSGTTTTGAFYSCLEQTASATCCHEVVSGMTDAGTHTGNAAVAWGYFIGTTNPGVGEEPRFLARCE